MALIKIIFPKARKIDITGSNLLSRQLNFLAVHIFKLSASVTLQFLGCNRNVGALVNWDAFQYSILNFTLEKEERIAAC